MEHIFVKPADLSRADHAGTFVHLLNAYMADPKGDTRSSAPPLDTSVAENVARLAHAAVFFAKMQGVYVGQAVCFWGFSTFRNRPLLNVHDLIVLPPYRRMGVATALLAHIEEFARQEGACKLTLEVREDNEPAAALYTRFGFADEKVPMRFRVKYLG